MFGRNKTHDLQDRLERLERDFKGLQLEWESVYDKVRKAMARAVKSYARMTELEEQKASADPEQAEGPPASTGFLTARQKTIQQQILARRSRANGGTQ